MKIADSGVAIVDCQSSAHGAVLIECVKNSVAAIADL